MNDKRYPAVMEKELASLVASEVNVKKRSDDDLREAQKLLKKDPDLSMVKITEAQDRINSFQRTIQAFKEKQKAFDEARTSHLERIKNADQSIQNTTVYLTGLKEKGYFVSIDKELVVVRKDWKSAQDILSVKDDVPDYHVVIKYAENVAKEARKVQTAWDERLNVQQTNNQALKRLSLWSGNQMKIAYQLALEKLKARAPSEVWESLAEDIKQKEVTLKVEFSRLSRDAEILNGTEKQEFTAAAKTIKRLDDLIKNVELSLQQPGKTLQEFIEAELKAATMASQAVSKINQAEKVVKGPDNTEGAGRGALAKAKEEVSKAENLKKSGLPNWLLVAGILTGAITLAQASEKQAWDKIDELRRRKMDEENRRQREEYKKERDRINSWSSSSSSYSSSSSFGGFGGGGFGGGGASGGW